MALTKQLSAAAYKTECLYKELIDAIVSYQHLHHLAEQLSHQLRTVDQHQE